MKTLSNDTITSTEWHHHSAASIAADLALLSDAWLDDIAIMLLEGTGDDPIDYRIEMTKRVQTRETQLSFIANSIDMALDRDQGSICRSCGRELDYVPETEMCSGCEIDADEVAASDADGRDWFQAQQ